jgi:cob(I)alamin adenosyltransferase
MELVLQYRLYAEECRTLSGKISRSDEKQALESMARAWERVAEREVRLLKQIETRSGLLNSTTGKGTSAPTD